MSIQWLGFDSACSFYTAHSLPTSHVHIHIHKFSSCRSYTFVLTSIFLLLLSACLLLPVCLHFTSTHSRIILLFVLLLFFVLLAAINGSHIPHSSSFSYNFYSVQKLWVCMCVYVRAQATIYSKINIVFRNKSSLSDIGVNLENNKRMGLLKNQIFYTHMHKLGLMF